MLVLTIFTGAQLMAANTLFPNVTPEMTSPDYWIANLSQTGAPGMTAKQIEELNRQTAQNLPGILVDLASITQQISPELISGWIQTPSFPKDPQFYQGQPLPAGFFEKIRLTMNLAGITGKTMYGITVRRADIRTFPTDCAIFSTPDDREFDNLQETTVNPGEAVVILHQSVDRQWSYIQTSNYRGWMASTSIAVTPLKDEWLIFQNPSDFLIVTDPSISIKDPDRPDTPALFYEMGARIPLIFPAGASKTYRVILPDRSMDGKLIAKTIALPDPTGFHRGYLPYNQAGLIRQAFKMLGRRYGWGGMFEGVDCSSFTMDVYRCFGIILPRNSGEQARSGLTSVDFSQADLAMRHRLIASLPAGSLLFLKGHVMFYLGSVNGRHYVIHALSAFGRPDGTNPYQRVNVLQVVLSDLELTRTNGNTLLQSLTVGKSL
jgi:hypothetical protein